MGRRNNMKLETKIEMVMNQAKLIIRDYEKYDGLDAETAKDGIYCQGCLDMILDILSREPELPYDRNEVLELWGKLQEILFD